MPIGIFRAAELYNRGGKRGVFNVGKSHFYETVEPQLERVALGERAVGYTERSVERVIRQGIAKAKRATVEA
jgi:hypothetical protein